jgi:arylsulfatase A-like enzyme
MRVPFIAAWAKSSDDNAFQQRLPIVAGAIQNQPAAVHDLFPTILALTDIESPDSHVVDGLRLDRLLTGKFDKMRPEKFLMHYPHAPHRSNYFTCYREGDWKVIYHYYPSKASEDSHYQLYNLADDPFESQNLAAARPEQLRRMVSGLIAELEHHDAVYPVAKSDGKTPLRPELP